jgi:hypothetical protein
MRFTGLLSVLIFAVAPLFSACSTSAQTGLPPHRTALANRNFLPPKIVQASTLNSATSIDLAPARMYFYGAATGGAFFSSPFTNGLRKIATDPAGYLSAQLAFGNSPRNTYDTQTEYHVIGGVSVEGSWESFNSFYGSNESAGASTAKVDFTVPGDSLVIVIALASSQQKIELDGLDLKRDSLTQGPGTEAMTIAHAYLHTGDYSITEVSSATVPGQDPMHMADLIGVFVLGSRDDSHHWIATLDKSRSPETNNSNDSTSIPSLNDNLPVVQSARECAVGGVEGAVNNTHGTIRVIAGTNSFSAINSGLKRINASPGQPLEGIITVEALNRGPGFAVAPMIYTPSWGDHQTSFRTIVRDLRSAPSTQNVPIRLSAPSEAGTYYLIFAFQLELSGANVASGTNWSTRRDVWNDGNDIAEFNASQLESARRWGCALDAWLLPEGPKLFYVPADAIVIQVYGSAAETLNQRF